MIVYVRVADRMIILEKKTFEDRYGNTWTVTYKSGWYRV